MTDRGYLSDPAITDVLEKVRRDLVAIGAAAGGSRDAGRVVRSMVAASIARIDAVGKTG